MQSYIQPRDDSINILLADDDDDTLTLFKRMADERGWNSVCVSTAQGIIDAVNENEEEFDAIISDVNFLNEDTTLRPRMTGIAAVKQIRKVEMDTPVVFVTGYTNNMIREEIRRVSAEMIAKPIDPFALFDHLERLIDWHRKSSGYGYDGPERRKSAVNQSTESRRKTDRKVQSPEIVRQIINEVREEEKKLCEETTTLQSLYQKR